MKIEDTETKEEIVSVLLRLTRQEAAELRDSLEALLDTSELGRHEHVSDQSYQKEITVILTE